MKKEDVNSNANPRNDFLDSYFTTPRFSSKFWLRVFFIAMLVLAILYFKKFVVDDSMTGEEVKNSIQLTDQTSRWVLKEKIKSEDFNGVVIAPEIRFHFRNQGPKDLRYVFFLGVFRFADSGKRIDEGYFRAARKPLKPGQISESVLIRAGAGYKASSLDAFQNNRKEWKRVFVEVFAKSKQSAWVPIQQFFIRQVLEGENLEIRLEENPS